MNNFPKRSLSVLIFLSAYLGLALGTPCTERDDYTGVASDCSKFLRCVNGEFVEFQCASGTLFDASNKICEHERLVNCLSRPLPDTECNDSDDFSIVQGDCSKFLRCVHGNFIELQCPNGTLFNSTLRVCDHSENVNCALYQNITSRPTLPTQPTTFRTTTNQRTTPTFPTYSSTQATTMSTSQAVIETSTAERKPVVCTSKDDFTGVADDCHKYKRCFNGSFFLISCPSDWQFDYIFKRCFNPMRDSAVCFFE